MKKQIKAILFAAALMLAGTVAGSVTANAETPEIKYSGTDGSIEWSIDENGHLLLIGDGDFDKYADWTDSEYCREVKTATVKVKNMTRTDGMFDCCQNMTHIDFSEFNTSKVTNMNFMFYGCDSLVTIDLSGFDTSNVTDMSYMFECCGNLKSLDLSKFNTENVEAMEEMFYMCESLETLDVSGFDTGKVKNMTAMFGKCMQLKEIDLSNWDLSSLTSAERMFRTMKVLTRITLPNSPIELDLPDVFYDEKNNPTDVAPANQGKMTYRLATYADSYCYKNGHTYCLPIFTWAEDYSSAKVYIECTRKDCKYNTDDKYLQLNAVVTKATIEPTSKAEGATIYTATAVYKGNTYSDKKSVSIPKLPAQQEQQEQQQPTPQAPTAQPAAKPVGTILKTSKASYRVTKSGKTPEVAYAKLKSKKVKTVTIPATVKIGKITYKVTSVADNALKNYKNLTKVTVGTNVKKIGKNAFCGCKKLSKIVIKSKKLKSVGKNAFKGIKKNATMDVPNSKKKTYKKLFTGKTGYKKTMSVK